VDGGYHLVGRKQEDASDMRWCELATAWLFYYVHTPDAALAGLVRRVVPPPKARLIWAKARYQA